jgi:hypothetical protein
MEKEEQPSGLFKKWSERLTYFMQKAKSMDSPRDLLRFVLYPSATSQGGPVVLLAKTYPSLDDVEFLDGICR